LFGWFVIFLFLGECLGGALYWKNLAILAQKIGFCTPRLVTANLITVQNKELERVIGKKEQWGMLKLLLEWFKCGV